MKQLTLVTIREDDQAYFACLYECEVNKRRLNMLNKKIARVSQEPILQRKDNHVKDLQLEANMNELPTATC